VTGVQTCALPIYLFNLGDVENIIVEGKEVKMLLTTLGTNKISIFMEKTADHADVLMRISQ
jgi:predicted regulator of Ras-like GTPase activity (Roadblock/LC7/MglB family)